MLATKQLSFCSLLALLSAASAAATAAPSAAAGKVPVVIMVESYCPCSGAWPFEFYEKLLPQIGELVTLDRFFDASSNPLASRTGRSPLIHPNPIPHEQ